MYFQLPRIRTEGSGSAGPTSLLAIGKSGFLGVGNFALPAGSWSAPQRRTHHDQEPEHAMRQQRERPVTGGWHVDLGDAHPPSLEGMRSEDLDVK